MQRSFLHSTKYQKAVDIASKQKIVVSWIFYCPSILGNLAFGSLEIMRMTPAPFSTQYSFICLIVNFRRQKAIISTISCQCYPRVRNVAL